MPTTAGKKIFISDIHMGDVRSLQNSPHYGWFQDNIPVLAEFLAAQLEESSGVEEVVILGDLLDRWVIPADQDPLPDFQAIVECEENKPVITALRNLAEAKKLTYIPGNHDMDGSDEEQAATRKFMESAFEGIRYDPHENGKYVNGPIVGEHGNRYALFNAPDSRTWTLDPPSRLPVGYFISREDAYRVASGSPGHFHDVLKSFVYKFIRNPNFIYLLFTGVAQNAGRNLDETTNMKNIKGFPAQPTVDAIGAHYQDLIKKWQEGKPEGLDWQMAVAGDIGQLLLAAVVVHFLHGNPPPKIVVFGHTHRPELWKIYRRRKLTPKILTILDKTLDELLEDLQIPDLQVSEIIKEFVVVKDILPIDLFDRPCDCIYANSGAWVDKSHKHTCTYVEIEEEAKEKDRRLSVRVKAFPAKELYNGYVNI